MNAADDPVAQLSRALDQTAAVVDGVREAQTTQPTPCRSWNVGELLDHLVHDLDQFTVAARGESPDWSLSAPPAGPDWAGLFRERAGRLIEAWRQTGDLSGTVTLPGLGEVPARFPVDQQIAEFAVHGWDLATATGQNPPLDPEIAETSLQWMHGALRPEFRGTEEEGRAFGPQAPAPDDAPPYDRLAAFAGRRPR
ncbi:TIGR03086 family metal-binding protein [Wenjunlia tyrosinilytica]|uniref:TIGR03086 family protein n=1 Tax=Wenjunlia tyrosinilytica TaxID=1544741 RepID=A0A918DWH4_9ACTN|nr:TIGR03086 family metal-binding protein [Wenjunlia tyrosinilytica]GGO87664.1 TIGR03086 family protein [Wenjunlia tyrosinilytica]